MPTLRRIALASAPFLAISTPLIATCPEVGCKRPLRSCTKVDLPDPVCPMIPRNCPSSMVTLISRKACFSKGVPGP